MYWVLYKLHNRTHFILPIVSENFLHYGRFENSHLDEKLKLNVDYDVESLLHLRYCTLAISKRYRTRKDVDF